LPNSDVKFFFVCSLNIASKRRYKELKKLNNKLKLNNVKKALKLRNISDIKRKHSPLKKHKNAVVVNSGKLNKQAMLVKMSKHVEKVIKLKYGK
jgi:Cytidylate kinase